WQRGMRGTDAQRCSNALICECRRQAHVENAQLGCSGLDARFETLCVRQRSHNLMPRVFEQADKALAQQHGIFTDQNAHGTLTSTVVGPPCGLAMLISPPAARTRFEMPSRPPPGCTVAPPMPLSSTLA